MAWVRVHSLAITAMYFVNCQSMGLGPGLPLGLEAPRYDA